MENISDIFLNNPEFIKQGQCCKYLFRHSLRPPLHDQTNPDSVLLSNEGIQLAEQFGRNLPLEIGEVHTSHIERCIQTVKHIISGSFTNITPIISDNVLGNVFSDNQALANQSIRDISLKGVVHSLQAGEIVPGVFPIEFCVKKILDYIFSTGNISDRINLYCTHDFHIAMIISVFFIEDNSLESIKSNWPKMMEGILFVGRRNDFYCCWRGHTKHVKEYLINMP